MGLFNRSKKKNENANKSENTWDTAHYAEANFYAQDDGNAICVFALTEGALLALPKNPYYAVDDVAVSAYRLFLCSATNDSVSGDIEYFAAIEELQKYVLDKKDGLLLVRPLSLHEIVELYNKLSDGFQD